MNRLLVLIFVSVLTTALRVASGQSCPWDQPLIPTNGDAGDNWGRTVAVSGTDVFLSSDYFGGGNARKIAVFRRNATGFVQSQLITPGMQIDSMVAASHTLVVTKVQSTTVGTVRIYRRGPDGAYAFVQSISGTVSGEDFGRGTAISEDATTLVIGSPYAGAQPNQFSGKAFVYGRNSGGTYDLLTVLTPPGIVAGLEFGRLVAASGSRILVAQGSDQRAYVYLRNGSSVVPETTSPLTNSSILPSDDIAMSGDWACTRSQDRIDLFERTGNAWQMRQTLVGDFYGDIDLRDETLVAGRPNNDANRLELAVFRRQGSPPQWTQTDTIESVLPSIGSSQYPRVAMSGDMVAMADESYDYGLSYDHGTAVVIDTQFSDCDGNSIADECDIAAGTSMDLNANTVPDSCESIAVPSGLSATDGTSASQVTLTWTPVAGLFHHQVERSIDGATWTILSQQASSPFNDTTAVPLVPYQYLVRAVYPGGPSLPGSADTGWRNVAPPTGVQASDGSSVQSVSVNWTAMPVALGYRVFRASGAGQPVEVGAPDSNSFIDDSGTPGIPYVYTVKARVSLGDTAASQGDVGWRNLPPPVDVAATDGTSTAGVTVSWTGIDGATAYRIERALGTAAFITIGTSPAEIASFTDSGPNAPSAGTTYAYRVITSSAAGQSLPSQPDIGWRSLGAPTGLSASDGLTNGIQLSWNGVLGAVDYRIYRSFGTAPPDVFTTVTPSFLDTTALVGEAYTYMVRARSPAGESVASDPETGWRSVQAPTGLVATEGSLSVGIQLTWNEVPAANGYKIFRRLGGAAATLVGTPSVETFLDTTAAAGVQYAYTVRAATPAGDSAESPADTGWRNLPPPVGVSASDGASTVGVNLTWTPVEGAIGYRVFRTTGSAPPSQVGIPVDSTFVDTTAAAGTLYTYSVKSRCFLGDSIPSGPETGWLNLPAPTGIAATDGTLSTGVNVTWTAVPGASGYRVFRTSASSADVEVGSPTASPYLDASAVPGVPCTYTVRTRTAAGNSAPSAPDAGWRGLGVPTGVAASDGTAIEGVTISWTAVNGAVDYRVLRAQGTAGPVVVGTPVSSPFTDDSAIAGTTYSYSVRARAEAGESATSGADAGWRNLPAPSGLTASDGSSTTGVNLSWNIEPGATGYRVYRAIGAANPTEVGAPASTTYLDSTAVAGTTYQYTVRARSASGNSAASVQDSGWRNVPAPSSVAASDGTLTTGISVTWTASAGAGGYRVYRSTDGSPATEIAAPTSSPYLDAAAVPGILYAYSIRARTASGDSLMSGTDSGWRQVSTPTGLAATDGTRTDAVGLTWTPVAGATGYRIFRRIGTTEIEAGTSPEASFADSSAVAGTVYTYRVRAFTALSESALGTPETGWRNLPPPSGLLASDGQYTTGVNLSWNAVAGSTGYKVFRGIGTAVPTQVATTVIPAYSDNSAVAGTLYTYSVRSQTTAGDSAPSVGDGGWRNVASPASIAATDGSSTTAVTVSWTTVAGAAGYRVYRSSQGQPSEEIASPTATPYLDTTAFAGTTYTYWVRARTAAGDSLPNGTADTGWRNLPPPTDLTATDGTRTDGVGLAWSPVTGALGYRVFRAIGTGTPAEIGMPDLAQFTDVTAVIGTVYTYTVKVRTPSGDSVSSGSNTGWRGIAPPASLVASNGASTTSVSLTWDFVPGATGYQLFRSTGSAPATPIASMAATINVHADSSAVAGTPYTYTVRALTAAGPSADSIPDDGWRNVPAPTGLLATDGTFADRVRLTWSGSTDAAVLGYRIMRTLPGGKTSQLTIVTPRTVVDFDDVSIPEGVIATYSVQCVTAAGYSLDSPTNTGFRGSTAIGDPPTDEAPGSQGSDASSGTFAGLAPGDPGLADAASDRVPHGDSPGTIDDADGLEDPVSCEEAIGSIESRLEALGNGPLDGASGAHGIEELEMLAGLHPESPDPDDRASAAAPPACRMIEGDMDLDGDVDWTDLAVFLGWWGSLDPMADLDRDGSLRPRDLEVALRAFGFIAPSVAGPGRDVNPTRPAGWVP